MFLCPRWSSAVDGSHRRHTTTSKSVIDLRSSLDEEVVQLVTFRGSEHLLRGVSLRHVLHGGAQVFESSTGSASTYGLSKQVSRIDIFLSHNWAVGRLGKFAALAFYFNARLSTVPMLVVAGVLGPLTIAGQLPTVQESLWPHGSGVCCRLFVFPFVFIATVFFRDLLSCLCSGGPVVFLDKICIHQVDKRLQKLALEKLGAFLANSDTMVVAYSGLYLRKLWTVYELASFLALHPVADMRVVPIMQGMLFFALWTYFYFHNCLNVVARVYLPFHGPLVTAFVRAIASISLCGVFRSWARERAAIQSRLKTFSVRDCSCAVESDRPIIYSNIARLMVASRRVPSNASEEVAPEAFDKLVQIKMPSAFAAALGGTAFDYTHWLILFAIDAGPACLDKLAGVSTNMSLREALAIVNYYGLWMCTLWPLVALLMEWFSRHFLALGGWRQWAYIVSVVLFIIVPAMFLNDALRKLRERAGASTVALAAYFLANAVGAAAAWTATTRCRRRPKERLQGAGGALEMVRSGAAASSDRSTGESVAPSSGRSTGERESVWASRPIGEQENGADSVCDLTEERDFVHEPPLEPKIRFAAI